jgi:hypothetical protein
MIALPTNNRTLKKTIALSKTDRTSPSTNDRIQSHHQLIALNPINKNDRTFKS